MADYDFQNRELIECNTCGRSTWHRLVYSNSFDVNFYDGSEFFGELTEKWDLFQCMGCSNVTAKRTLGDDKYVTTDYHPERTYAHHKRKHYLNIPGKLDKLYVEIIDTYNRKNYILCASGLRALLEGICLDKGITEGLNEQGKLSNSLEGKINGLSRIVPSNIVKNLHSFRFLGNKALHELEIPEPSDLHLSIMVIEDILNVVYALDYVTQILSDRISPSKLRTTNNEEPSI